jgi:signal transduction histidine kinase
MKTVPGSTTAHPKPLPPPTGQEIENFSDILADEPNQAGVCQTALRYALATINRKAGVLMVQSPDEQAPTRITVQNLPDGWAVLLADSSSPLFQAANQVLRSGQFMIGETAIRGGLLNDLAAAIPLPSRIGPQGVLLVHGAPCSPVEIDWLLKLSRPIGRSIHVNRIEHSEDPAPSDATPETSLSRNYQSTETRSLEGLQTELADSRRLLQALIEHLPVGLYIVDRKFQLVAANPAMFEQIKRSSSSLPGKTCFQALYQREEICSDCQIRLTLETGQSIHQVVRDREGLNEQNAWDVRIYPILDESGKIVQTIIISEDISEKSRLEAIVAQSEKLSALGQLATSMVHEINNPLTAIIANAQLLRRDLPPGDELIESVDLISLAGARAAESVRNLLDFARTEPGAYSRMANPTSVDIIETIKAALSLVQHEIIAHSITLSFNSPEQLPPIKGRSDSLQGVWLNLLLNAVASLNKPTKTIAISCRRIGDEIHVAIADNGHGIPTDQLEHIFEPFYTTKAAGRGTGLGLSVVNQVVVQHNGRVQVKSQPGEGSEFTVILPIR